MSRVGLSPVKIPDGVEVTLSQGTLRAKGKLGELSYAIGRSMKVTKDDQNKTIVIAPADDEDDTLRPVWGTTRANINNVLLGVSKGFEKVLEVNGVGYRASVQGKKIVLQLGKSHDEQMEIPAGLTAKVDKNQIIISGADIQKVGGFAAKVRQLRKPEPYKGKGIKYDNEYVQRKEGKKK